MSRFGIARTLKQRWDCGPPGSNDSIESPVKILVFIICITYRDRKFIVESDTLILHNLNNLIQLLNLIFFIIL